MKFGAFWILLLALQLMIPSAWAAYLRYQELERRIEELERRLAQQPGERRAKYPPQR